MTERLAHFGGHVGGIAVGICLQDIRSLHHQRRAMFKTCLAPFGKTRIRRLDGCDHLRWRVGCKFLDDCAIRRIYGFDSLVRHDHLVLGVLLMKGMLVE